MAHIVHQGWTPGGRRTFELEMAAFNPNMAIIPQAAVRLEAMRAFVVSQFRDLTRNGDRYLMSVQMNVGDSVRLVEIGSHGDRRVHRTFNSIAEIDVHFAAALLDTFEDITQSDDDINWDDIIFVINFDKSIAPRARGKISKALRKTIASDHTGGLAKYEYTDGMCGVQAIIYALVTRQTLRDNWTGDFGWFMHEFGTAQICATNLKQGRRSKERFVNLGAALGRLLHLDAPYEWIMGSSGLATANRFVIAQPKFQIVIFNEVTRQLIDVRRGLQFDLSAENSILLSYTLGHLHLINTPMSYFGKNWNNRGEHFCYACLQYKPHREHLCADYMQCDRCLAKFQTEPHRAAHCRWEREQPQCPRCDKIFYNGVCRDAHKCLAQHVDVCEFCSKRIYAYMLPHVCNEYVCRGCRQKVMAGHRCSMPKLAMPAEMEAENAGRRYFAFDLESMLLANPEKGTWKHEVNLVCVRQCFSNTEYRFNTLKEFVRWIESQAEELTLFAHNLKGYDGRLVFEYLFDKHVPPQEMVWRGSKIMSMVYGKAKFMDTLLHMPASLDMLPKMFGLDETEFKKGFFPYKFNTPANQNYVGPIPPLHFFEPDRMKPKKRAEFLRWYPEQNGVYAFPIELTEYCQSDVRILAKSIEAYMTQQMTRYTLNPFDRLTIASYAMTVYRTLFMPEYQIARLGRNEGNLIRQAMHGGRVDVRCMLREWTAEQVAGGVYGRYQDVQSLYPTVQFYDPMPVGAPRMRSFLSDEFPSDEEALGVFGFICCDIEPTQYLHHPVLVDLDPATGRLIADLRPKTKIVVPTPEFRLAIENGYRVTRYHWWADFDQSTELFKPYFRVFIKAKIEASGMPDWVKTEQDWNEFADYHYNELGIPLERDKMVKNAAQKTGAKLLCNSLWGKFGEKSSYYTYSRYLNGSQDDKIMGLEQQWLDGEIDITYRKYSGDDHAVAIIYKKNQPQNISQDKTNIALAALVTSHARCRLWAEMAKLGDRVMYHDTDSIIYERRPDAYNIPEGRYLGEWECETGGKPIVKFVATAPKCYSYVVDTGAKLEEHTKIKGISLTSENANLINFESLKALVLGSVKEIKTRSLGFVYDRQAGEMSTKDIEKLFTMNYQKGQVDRETLVVYPFGSDRFL